MAWRKIEFKLAQAHRALEKLSNARGREAFYDGLTLFLSAARGTVSVLQFQYGLSEFKKGEKAAGTNRHLTLTSAEEARRRSFDAWFRLAADSVVKHPLKADRDSDVHREGVSSAKFRLPYGAGLLLETGGPMGTPFVVGRGRPWAPPLEGPRPEDFYFEFDRARPALDVCRDYLGQIQSLVQVARTQT